MGKDAEVADEVACHMAQRQCTGTDFGKWWLDGDGEGWDPGKGDMRNMMMLSFCTGDDHSGEGEGLSVRVVRLAAMTTK